MTAPDGERAARCGHGTACEHEAAHGVVAAVLGTELRMMWVSPDEAAGQTWLGPAGPAARAAAAMAGMVWVHGNRGLGAPYGDYAADYREAQDATGGDDERMETAVRTAYTVLAEHAAEVRGLARLLDEAAASRGGWLLAEDLASFAVRNKLSV